MSAVTKKRMDSHLCLLLTSSQSFSLPCLWRAHWESKSISAKLLCNHVYCQKHYCDGSPTLPVTAGQWVWLGGSSREGCPPVHPSIKA